MDLNGIQQDPSPNFGTRGVSKITHIVLHCPVGTDDGALATLKNPANPKGRVSAHYLIKRDGTPIQLVKLEDSAWHVNNANPFSIGIEITDMYLIDKTLSRGCTGDPHWLTYPQLDTLTDLVAALVQKFNIPLQNVIGHNNPWLRQFGNNHADPGPYFPWKAFGQRVQLRLATPVVAPAALPAACPDGVCEKPPEWNPLHRTKRRDR